MGSDNVVAVDPEIIALRRKRRLSNAFGRERVPPRVPTKRLVFIFGTRPEIIKMSPILKACDALRVPYDVIHTGQHYSRELDEVFFQQLELRQPNLNLHVGSSGHGEQTGKILAGVEGYLLKERPDFVVVQGDTNSTLGGALAAVKLGIPVAHVEAGLRSDDRTMPEEINRIAADHICDLLLAPTRGAAKRLAAEGIPAKRVKVTGNTVVDAVKANLRIAKGLPVSEVERELGDERYVLMTIHRQENVESGERLGSIIEGVKAIQKKVGAEVVFPMHPRTAARLAKWKLDVSMFRTTPPIDFFAFLRLQSKAMLVVTDSGGVQEESCILRVPVLTARDNTERPETVEVGANILVGTRKQVYVSEARRILKRRRDWRNPFGDGRAGLRIVKAIQAFGGTATKRAG